MTQDTIFSPFFATVFLTFLVWVYMYIRRISFITSRKLTPNELAVPGALAQISPPSVSNPSDNLKNLFEIPVLFYALVLYLFITKQVDTVYVNAAWVFVVLSIAHSISSYFGSTSTYLLRSRCGSSRSAQHLSTLAQLINLAQMS
jgi:hypothetical protein